MRDTLIAPLLDTFFSEIASTSNLSVRLSTSRLAVTNATRAKCTGKSSSKEWIAMSYRWTGLATSPFFCVVAASRAKAIELQRNLKIASAKLMADGVGNVLVHTRQTWKWGKVAT